MNAIFKLKLKETFKNGIKYLELSKFELDFTVKKISYYTENPANPEAGIIRDREMVAHRRCHTKVDVFR